MQKGTSSSQSLLVKEDKLECIQLTQWSVHVHLELSSILISIGIGTGPHKVETHFTEYFQKTLVF